MFELVENKTYGIRVTISPSRQLLYAHGSFDLVESWIPSVAIVPRKPSILQSKTNFSTEWTWTIASKKSSTTGQLWLGSFISNHRTRVDMLHWKSVYSYSFWLRPCCLWHFCIRFFIAMVNCLWNQLLCLVYRWRFVQMINDIVHHFQFVLEYLSSF